MYNAIRMKRKTLTLKGTVWLIVLIILGGMIFLRSEPPKQLGEIQPPKRTKLISAEEISRFESIVSKLRGLQFKNPVKIGFKNKKELRQKMVDSFEEEGKEFPKIQKALAKMGLIPKELDLNKLMVDLLTEQVAGFYDHRDKELYIVEPEKTEAGVIEETNEMIKMAAVHELTHALQDQNYDLNTLPTDPMENDDIATAVDGLVEGEAMYVMYDYILRQRGSDLALLPSIPEVPEPFAGGKNSLLNEAPLYIREGLLFPYTAGLKFVHRAKSEKGWESIDQMYKRLPASTEQVLHPEKYLREPPDYPTTIQLPDISKLFPSEQYDLLLKNVMGEFSLEVLLRDRLPNIKSKQASEGWDGDEFIVLEEKTTPLTKELSGKVNSLIANLESNDKTIREDAEKELSQMPTTIIPLLQTAGEKKATPQLKVSVKRLMESIYANHITLIWFTTWDSIKDAEEFYEGYTRLLSQKYETWKEATEVNSIDPHIKTNIWQKEKNFVFIQRRQTDVLIIENTSEEILRQLPGLIWGGVKKEELKEVKRIKPKEKKQNKKE